MRIEFAGETTKCHRHLHRILSELGFQPRDNTEFGNYKIDVTCDDLPNLGFEANGILFHGWKKKDKKRDAELLKNFSISVVRISEKLLDGKHDLEVREIILRSIDLRFGRDA